MVNICQWNLVVGGQKLALNEWKSDIYRIEQLKRADLYSYLWLLWLIYLGERQGNSQKGENSFPEFKQKHPWEKEFECVAEIKLDDIYGWNQKFSHMERTKYKSFYE